MHAVKIISIKKKMRNFIPYNNPKASSRSLEKESKKLTKQSKSKKAK